MQPAAERRLRQKLECVKQLLLRKQLPELNGSVTRRRFLVTLPEERPYWFVAFTVDSIHLLVLRLLTAMVLMVCFERYERDWRQQT